MGFKIYAKSMAKAGTAGMGVGMMFGSMFGLDAKWNQENIRDDITFHTDAIKSHQQGLAEARLNFETLTVSLGSTCLDGLEPYRAGNVLAKTPEETVVSDLLQNPAHPCGETSTAIRQSYVGIRSADHALVNEEQRLNENIRSLADNTDELAGSAGFMENFAGGALSFSVIGAFFGGLYRFHLNRLAAGEAQAAARLANEANGVPAA